MDQEHSSHAAHPPHGDGATRGYTDHKDDHLRRLKRIEGQARGLQRMIAEDVYCIDVLTQVSAMTRALESFALVLLEEHLEHCVAQAVRDGGDVADAKLAEASAAIARLVRS
ncbi:MAG: metal-sensitive transcriptional regulator [Propionicimonas sp.]